MKIFAKHWKYQPLLKLLRHDWSILRMPTIGHHRNYSTTDDRKERSWTTEEAMETPTFVSKRNRPRDKSLNELMMTVTKLMKMCKQRSNRTMHTRNMRLCCLVQSIYLFYIYFITKFIFTSAYIHFYFCHQPSRTLS